MATSHRPKRVVIVDADNPMVEIEGDFFWREDHEAIVATAREESYRAGFRAGWADAVRRSHAQPALAGRRRASFTCHRRIILRLAVASAALVVLDVLMSQLIR